ncbi:MAG: DUF3379 domain-containing protein, partial [Gammaproteobacteria bacterium]|nr:DUF3379 domain-containing protein [Gammaproteobacteria bacterium]
RVMLAATSQKTKAPWLAAAAAVLLVIGAGLFLFNSYTDEDLPGHVIEHLYHEAQLLVPTATELVPAPRLRQVLARTGVILNEEVQSVVHAGVCYFRGHLVSHLVVNSDNGPVTVLLLPDEKVDEATEIDEDGFRGVIMPVRGGSIAVIGSGSYPEKVERIFTRAVEWQT